MNDIEYIELVNKTSYEELHSNQEIKDYNKKLTEEYPFLLVRNRWTDKIVEKYDYSWTELDAMPEGWRRAFGIQMCQEIKEELEKYKYDPKDNWNESAVCENDTWLNHWRITELKEKYGTLRLYSNYEIGDVGKIIDKYEKLSWHTCIKCGKPAKYISKGWISPFCCDCANELNKENNFEFED